MDRSAQSLPELEHGPLLGEMGFVRISRSEGPEFGCDVFENDNCRLAFTISRHDGDNIFVAPRDAPLDSERIMARTGGWALVQEICQDFYAEYSALGRPHVLPRRDFAEIIDRALWRNSGKLFRQMPNNSFKPKSLRGSA